MTYPFVRTDGGKAEDKRRPHYGDCAIRAVTLATGIPYGDCYEELADFYNKRSGTRIKNWIDLQHYNETNFRGFTFNWIPFQAVKGERRMNPVTFCKQFKEGTYIAKTARHVFAVIDGVVYDSFRSRPDRCIYGAWKVESVSSPEAKPTEAVSLKPQPSKRQLLKAEA